LTLLELYRPQHERSVSVAVQGLGKTAFDAAFQHGRAMTIGEGVAFAVEDKQPPKPAQAAKPEPQVVFSGRQLDVARLIADDLSNKQIAARLFLSERTVETHVTNILNKLGLGSRIQISRWMTGLNEPGLTTAEKRPITAKQFASANRALDVDRQYPRERRTGRSGATSGRFSRPR
jgi:DNA-binding CsgD family transcriptional regulator